MIGFTTILALSGLIMRGVYAMYFSARRKPLSVSKPINKKNPQLNHRLKYSIVVCMHNEMKHIDSLLNSLLSQTPPPPEILIMNDGSTDGTSEKLSEYQESNPSIRVITLSEGGTGKKRPLAKGIIEAKHDVILCTDADCTAKSNIWASLMVKNIGTKYELKLGVSLPWKSNGFLGAMQNFEAERIALNYIGMAEAGFPYMGVGRNIAFLRSSWESVGGFDNHMHIASGDDDLFVQDLVGSGAKVGTVVMKEGQINSVWPETWGKWMKQIKRHLSTSTSYRKSTLALLSLPVIADVMLYGGVILEFMHSNIWIATSILVVNAVIRGLIFRTFLLRAGRPGIHTFMLLFEPVMGIIRQFLSLQALIVKPKEWK
jgi:glycosyltransferase involved in cell wall biosynthesis